MPFVLRSTSSAAEIKGYFDSEFDAESPLEHIHGAILTLCNAGFDNPRNRAGMNNLVINLSTLQADYSNIQLFFRNSLADGEGTIDRVMPRTYAHRDRHKRQNTSRAREHAIGVRRGSSFVATGGLARSGWGEGRTGKCQPLMVAMLKAPVL